MKLTYQNLWIKCPLTQSHNIIQLQEGPTFYEPEQPYTPWPYVNPDALKVYLNGKRLIGPQDIPGWSVKKNEGIEFDILNSGPTTRVTPGRIKILVETKDTDIILVEQTILSED